MTQPTVGTAAGSIQQFAPRFATEALPAADGREPEPRPVAPVRFAGDFADFADRLRDELAPAGVLEDLLAARLISAAWRLDRALLAQGDGGEFDDDLAGLDRSLAQAVATFHRARAARRGRWGQAAPSETVAVGFDAAPVEDEPASLADDLDWSPRFEPVPADEDEVDVEPQEEADDDSIDPSHLWRDRLVLDPSVSTRSPVVRGTWVTVGHVVTLVVDGWSWADILRAHPELTEADIRACLAYSVEEENSGCLDG